MSGELAYIQNGNCTVGRPLNLNVRIDGPGRSYNATAALLATQCLANVSTYRGTFSLDLSGAADGTYVSTFTTCCRIGGIQNVSTSGTELLSQVRKVTGQATGSPVLNSNVASGIGVGYPYAQNLNAADPEGGALTYTSLVGTANGPSADVVSYSAAGDVTIPALRTATMANGENWVYKVRVSDAQGDFSDRDVLLTATTANHPPQFSQLPPAGAIVVRPGQSWMRDQLQNVATLTCVGYADATGPTGHNAALGLRRARAVCAAVMKGTALRAARVRATSLGERHPRASNATAAGRALNRYVDVRVTYR